MSRARALSAFASGLLFGAGLVVSGMTQPRKVLGFLDVLGHWDPSLLLVMAGAVAVHALAYRWRAHRNAPLFAADFDLPKGRHVDARLLLGAAVFGVGWGMSGYCPGPSVVSLVGGAMPVVLFVLAMLAGMLVCSWLSAAWRSRRPHAATLTLTGK